MPDNQGNYTVDSQQPQASSVPATVAAILLDSIIGAAGGKVINEAMGNPINKFIADRNFKNKFLKKYLTGDYVGDVIGNFALGAPIAAGVGYLWDQYNKPNPEKYANPL